MASQSSARAGAPPFTPDWDDFPSTAPDQVEVWFAETKHYDFSVWAHAVTARPRDWVNLEHWVCKILNKHSWEFQSICLDIIRERVVLTALHFTKSEKGELVQEILAACLHENQLPWEEQCKHWVEQAIQTLLSRMIRIVKVRMNKEKLHRALFERKATYTLSSSPAFAISPASASIGSELAGAFDSGTLISASQAADSPKQKQNSLAALNLASPPPVVTITVGMNALKQVHVVQKQLICFHSRFFDNAFNKANMLEPETQSIDLPEIDPPSFGIFVDWLYVGRLEGALLGVKLSHGSLMLMLALAERFEVPTLQREVLGALASQDPHDEDDLEVFISQVYESEFENSALKRQAIDRTLRFITEDNVEKVKAIIPADMRVDLMEELLARYAEFPMEDRNAN